MGAWAEESNRKLFQRLQYMPVNLTGKNRRASSRAGKVRKKLSYSRTDVFSDSYGLRFSGNINFPLNDDTRISSLQQLLLRWFGIGRHDDLEEESI